jgi:hypothetical protein
MNRQVQVGFSQRIQLEWLEFTAQLLLTGSTRSEIQAAVNNFLEDKLSVGSESKSSSRRKTISILLRTWVGVPANLEPLRNEALDYLRTLPEDQHLAVHWGMIMAVYPFFAVVAETVGRLLRLQGTVAAVSVQRRIKEQLGERETVSRATRRVLRCFVDWGVLQDTNEKGIYEAASVQFVENRQLAVWLIEAALIASDSSSKSMSAIAQTPALFPFTINLLSFRDLENNKRLEWFNQGFDENMVMLRH